MNKVVFLLLSNMRVEKVFVYLAITFGLIFVLIVPPFQSPDEDSHFKRTYVISYGKFYPSVNNNEIGYYLPDDMVEYIANKLTNMGKLDVKYSFKELYLEEKVSADYSKQSFYTFSTVEVNPLAYMAPTLGVISGRIVAPLAGISGDTSAVYMLYFARIFSLISYVILIYFAIKITPILKKTFCMIGLLPMSLSLAAAVSYDNILIPLSLLLVAIILKLSYDDSVKKIDKKYFAAIILIGFILLTVKTVYATLLALLLFIPRRKWGKDKEKIKSLLMIGGFILLLTLLSKLPYMLLNIEDNGNSLASEQLKYILNNPFDYGITILRSIKNLFNYYLSGIVGTFGLLDTNLITPFVFFFFIGFILVGISDISLCEKKVTVFNRIIVILAVLASAFGIFTAMYIFWTSGLEGLGVGADIISGVQGRYFIPLLSTTFLIFSNDWISKNRNLKKVAQILLNNCYLLSIVILILSVLTIIFRYWC